MFDSSTKILLVDDAKGVRILVGKILKDLGFQNFIEAADGTEAWNLLNENHNNNSPIQLVIADMRMPNMSGMELLKKVRETSLFDKLPFVMLSAESEKENVVEAIKAGVSEYVVKPVNALSLKKKLENTWNLHFSK